MRRVRRGIGLSPKVGMFFETKKYKTTERKGSIVNVRKECSSAACENHMELSMCDGPKQTVFIKR